MKIISKILWLIFYLVLIGFLIWIAGQLFFKEQMDKFINEQKSKIFLEEEEIVSTARNLSIVYPSAPESLEPMVSDPEGRQRIINIYEPLVKMDKDLKPKSSLALNYGILDDYSWEFRLREGVKFHDGSDLDMDDVLSSFARARDFEGSEVKDAVSNIKDIDIVDDNCLIIRTKVPDPLLLQKISLIPIVPSRFIDDDIDDPVGTGPYKVKTIMYGQDLLLIRNESYWGDVPYYDTVQVLTVEDTMERVDVLMKGEADFLAFVPFDTALLLKSSGITVKSIPTLEVQFLIFNLKSQLLDEVQERDVIIKSINKEMLALRLGEYVNSVSQFVSSGVYGYNPRLVKEYYLPDEAKQLAFSENMSGKTIVAHLSEGLDVLGELLEESFVYVGIIPEIGYLNINDLKRSIASGSADIYFMAYKTAFGDAQEFLDSVAYSQGDNNLFGYSNEKVDDLIEQSRVQMNSNQRRDLLQQALEIVVEQDKIGLPLFEYETLYGYRDYLEYEPRIDGLIYYDDITYRTQ